MADEKVEKQLSPEEQAAEDLKQEQKERLDFQKNYVREDGQAIDLTKDTLPKDVDQAQ